MEIAYLMAGKRIRARDVADLNNKLAQYQLVSNLSTRGEGSFSARRIADPEGASRYNLTKSVGDPADKQGYDVVVGRTIGENGYEQEDIVEKEISELESVLDEVKIDIPDAKIIAGSHWS